MIDVSKIEKIMALMAKHGFDVVQAESSGEKISLARNVGQASIFQPQTNTFQHTVPMSMPSTAAVSLETKEEETPLSQITPAAVPSEETKKLPDGITITSPFVGTFYRSPGPDAAPFIELGSRIRKGQALCIVEAMKLMNEIEAEVDGEVVAILADNAKPVEFGTPLFIVAPVK